MRLEGLVPREELGVVVVLAVVEGAFLSTSLLSLKLDLEPDFWR